MNYISSDFWLFGKGILDWSKTTDSKIMKRFYVTNDDTNDIKTPLMLLTMSEDIVDL